MSCVWFVVSCVHFAAPHLRDGAYDSTTRLRNLVRSVWDMRRRIAKPGDFSIVAQKEAEADAVWPAIQIGEIDRLVSLLRCELRISVVLLCLASSFFVGCRAFHVVVLLVVFRSSLKVVSPLASYEITPLRAFCHQLFLVQKSIYVQAQKNK